MHLDVLKLRDFYYRNTLGRFAQKTIRDQLLKLWAPEHVKGQTVVGFGFSVPLLRPYLADARRVIALMPGQQGVMSWPADKPNVATLCEETRWPLETGLADRLVALHGLETSDRPGRLLEECHRVLGPGGQAIFIVPNRAGLWSRRDQTPFGYGRPYSLSQLEAQLRQHGLEPQRHVAALFTPPTSRRFWRRTAPFWEKTGQRISSYLAGGVLMVEVTKQVPARPKAGLPARVKRPLQVLEGLAKPETKPI